MSQWTHVAGLITLDNLGATIIRLIRFPGREELNKISKEVIRDEKLGYTCDYESSQEDWDKCNVPCGSEGSIQYDILIYPYEHSLVWGNVSIWGDLRDFGTNEYPGLKKWFEESCLNLTISPPKKGEIPAPAKDAKDLISMGFTIRDAVLIVRIEFHETYILTWDNNKKKIIEIVLKNKSRVELQSR